MAEGLAPSKGTTEAKKRLVWSRILRPAVSVVLMFFLLRGIDWSEFLLLIWRANPVLLALALSGILLAILLSAFKWQRFLVVQQVRVPLKRLFNFYLVGLFFNNFLPTNIGGDLVRINDLARSTGKYAESISSVIAERLAAALALALTALLGLVLSFQQSQRFGFIVLGLLAVTAVIIVFFAVENFWMPLWQKIHLPEKFDLRRRSGNLIGSLGKCLANRPNLVLVIILSMFFHLLVVLITYLIFLALGVDVSLVSCLLFVPIISAIQMLPISISGFGVREGAFVYFFGAVGLTSTLAIAVSLMFWFLVALVSLWGGVIFAVRR